MRTILWLALLSGCAYLDNRSDCNEACEVLFSEDGCSVPTEDAGVGPKTAIFACTQVCTGEEDQNREAFVDCVADSTCDSLNDGACDPDDFRGPVDP
ncbi:MAG: hypothetical protein AB8H79_25145 [Myxococcota bacterium]